MELLIEVSRRKLALLISGADASFLNWKPIYSQLPFGQIGPRLFVPLFLGLN